jgi:uncharacterized Tic20 family protein
MTAALSYAIAAAACVIAGVLLPAWGMRALAPTLASSGRLSTNYRGRTVYLGLGLVWVVWSVSLLVMSAVMEIIATVSGDPTSGHSLALYDGPLTLPLYGVPLMLVAVSVLLGLADDVFGSRGDKGFRGHLSALAHGRLTTGGLKLLGIGAVSAVYGWHIAWSRGGGAWGETLVVWALATLTIAASANFINLTDLRPGRALKAYSVLALVAAPVFVLDAVDGYVSYSASFAELGVDAWGALDSAVAVVLMACVLLGPVVAVWRFDLGEGGMLGDAGSNAMGAVVGYLLASALPVAWLALTAGLLLALNLLSERVSFSTVVDRVGPLRAVDRIGRRPIDTGNGDEPGGGGQMR